MLVPNKPPIPYSPPEDVSDTAEASDDEYSDIQPIPVGLGKVPLPNAGVRSSGGESVQRPPLPKGVNWEQSPLLDWPKDYNLSLLPDMMRQVAVAYMALHYARLQEPETEATILDAGCGFGESYFLLRGMRKGAGAKMNYIGVDVDYRKRDRALSVRSFDYRLADLAGDWDSVVPENNIDVILSSEVIEHLEYDAGIRYIDTCMSKLSPSGVMIITTPNEDIRRENDWHLYEWKNEELRTHIRNSGYEFEDDFFMKPNTRYIDKLFGLVKRKNRMPTQVLRSVLFGNIPGSVSVFVIRNPRV